jgi:uncharacterized protein
MEIDESLGDAATRIKETYGISNYGNWDGHNILNRSAQLQLGDENLENILANRREKVFVIRTNRVWPQRAEKVLADWNGLVITALARAGDIFAEPDWIAAAASAYKFVLAEMAGGDRLFHSWCAGRAQHPAVIEDYANMAGGEGAYLAQAEAWAKVANLHHWDGIHHGYFMSANDTSGLITRPKPIHDNATPPGNGTMANVLARLYHLTGTEAYRDRLAKLLAALTPPEPEKALHQLSMLMGFEILHGGIQIFITGEGAAAAYVCVGTTCTLPLTEPKDLEDHLRTL